jgi:hypothetical protein
MIEHSEVGQQEANQLVELELIVMLLRAKETTFRVMFAISGGNSIAMLSMKARRRICGCGPPV